ncbi:MAG: hypothetical protein QOI40_5630 [Alphaproteobacteria bacterium]|jgi:hypothetical protein|nr:hypothetical protein [Alphaproteobacteria bacterium]
MVFTSLLSVEEVRESNPFERAIFIDGDFFPERNAGTHQPAMSPPAHNRKVRSRRSGAARPAATTFATSWH